MKVKHFYIRLLEDILGMQDYFGSMVDTLNPKLQRIVATHLADVRTIQDELSLREPSRAEVDFTSHEEMHFLMNPFEEEIDA